MLPMSCSEPSGSLDEDDVAETESFWDSAEPEVCECLCSIQHLCGCNK